MKWDDHALRLLVIDAEEDTHSDIVHWIQKFPFPLNNRDYLYVRRYCLDTSVPSSPKIIMRCHSTQHPGVHAEKKSVRVNNYESSLIIQSKTQPDEVCSPSQGPLHRIHIFELLERNEILVNLSWRYQCINAYIDLLVFSSKWSVQCFSRYGEITIFCLLGLPTFVEKLHMAAKKLPKCKPSWYSVRFLRRAISSLVSSKTLSPSWFTSTLPFRERPIGLNFETR